MYRKFIASFLPLLVAACAGLQKPTPTVNVPDKLKPPANESLAMIVPARGVQIYECRAKKDQAGSYEWAFVAPEADLFDTSGRKIGRHYAGPHWESTDGSKFAGTVKESTDAPQADAIPWLLLVTKSVGSQGSFSKITEPSASSQEQRMKQALFQRHLTPVFPLLKFLCYSRGPSS